MKKYCHRENENIHQLLINYAKSIKLQTKSCDLIKETLLGPAVASNHFTANLEDLSTGLCATSAYR